MTLRRPAAPARAAAKPGRVNMVAIGVILLFIIAIGALNAFEFGRVD